MNDNIITAERVLDLTRELVHERGEGWTYPGTEPHRPVSTSCHYRWDSWDVGQGTVPKEKVGQPACIVGGILDRLGVLDTVVPVDDEQPGEYHYNSSAVRDLLDEDDSIEVDPLARAVMHELQSSQDSGLTWGVALRRAESKLHSLRFGLTS